MGQAMPRRQILIIDQDDEARHLAGVLFEESELLPVDCDTVDDALRRLETSGDRVAAVFVDLDAAGPAAAALLERVHAECPWVRVIATGGDGAPRLDTRDRFMPKPWLPLDLLIAAETAAERPLPGKAH